MFVQEGETGSESGLCTGMRASCSSNLRNLPRYSPVAVTESDGFTKIYLNSNDETNSTLPLNEEAAAKWRSKRPIRAVGGAIVPTMRLDTFMRLMNIHSVDYLKVDAQGNDLSVVRSAGERIKDIKKVRMEVQVTDVPVYEGAGTKDGILEYISENGFLLVEASQQSHGQEENLLFCRPDS